MKKAKKNFTTLQSKIADLKQDESGLSYPDVESQADSLFLSKDNYQGLEPKDNTTGHNLIYNGINKIFIQKNWT